MTPKHFKRKYSTFHQDKSEIFYFIFAPFLLAFASKVPKVFTIVYFTLCRFPMCSNAFRASPYHQANHDISFIIKQEQALDKRKFGTKRLKSPYSL